jgi:hypothetical protein
MITDNQKTSLLISSQLPEFIRDFRDSSGNNNFLLFLEAYYEWMEQNGQVTERSKNLLSYKDIDTTTEEFIKYFTNDFLPYFPKESLISQQEAVKVARQLYQTKGTPASYKFLFRILFNSDVDIFYTKDAVLKASDGIWYVAKSLKLASEDDNLLKIANYRLFGETTKSIATVETAVKSGTKTEVFISNIERLFQSGEFVRVVDNNNQTVLFNGEPLRAKVVGQLSQIKIDSQNRGSLYQPGDPVIVYGGLNSNTGIGATAEVASTTAGEIQRIYVNNGGFGYREDPNTSINIQYGGGAIAIVGGINPNANGVANVSIPYDAISLSSHVSIGNPTYSFFTGHPTANANTALANAFSFATFTTYPISSVLVKNGGGGITQTPIISATSLYTTSDTTTADLGALGILGPIQIISGGSGYRANDVIVFSGGSGVGAKANVATVNATGAITSVEYVLDSKFKYPLGGQNYNSSYLPSLTVSSANTSAANAVLTVTGILGQGASFSVYTDRAGSISTINVTEPGEDYIATPNVSFKVQDIVVANVSSSNPPLKGDIVYQGTSVNTSSYKATVDSVLELSENNDPTLSLYNLRVFNYNTTPNTSLKLSVDRNIHMIPANSAFPQYTTTIISNGKTYTRTYDNKGVLTYGDGNAKGFAKFLNGLVISQGQYLSSRGQPSSFDVLQSSTYNNFTYELTVEKEIAKYRDVLLNLLHPTGMKVVGRFAMKSNSHIDYHGLEALYTGKTLSNYTGYPGSSVTMVSDFTHPSNNIIKFNDLAGANLAGFLFSNSIIEVTPTNGPNIRSELISFSTVSNTVVLKTNTWLTFANVAFVSSNTHSNVINIKSLTNSYNIVNNGNYSNTSYPLKDIVYAGDKILIGSNTSNSRVVSSVDYENGIIYLTSNSSLTSTNTLLSVNRTLSAQTAVRIYGPLGQQYIPQLTTENGDILTTEAGQIILLG